MFDITFEKQLEKTLKAHVKYTNECEKLKEIFCDEYDKATILALLELLITKHPGEQTFAKEFMEHYENDNYSDQEISTFQKMFHKYKKELVNKLESNGEDI